MVRTLAATLLLFFGVSIANAETPVAQLMGDKLRAGQLLELEQDLTARLDMWANVDYLRCMFDEVLRRLPDLQLAPGAELPYRASNFISGPEAMPVVFSPA